MTRHKTAEGGGEARRGEGNWMSTLNYLSLDQGSQVVVVVVVVHREAPSSGGCSTKLAQRNKSLRKKKL